MTGFMGKIYWSILLLWLIIFSLPEANSFEWNITDQYVPSNTSIGGIIYPPKKCKEVPPPITARKRKSEQGRSFSSLFNHYYFPVGQFEERNRRYRTDRKGSILEAWGLILWLCYMAASYLISMLLLPVAGLIIFRLLGLIGLLIANRWTRYYVRRALIRYQRMKRTKDYYLTPDGRKPAPNRFRIPKILREDSDEDVPPELFEPPSSDFSENDSENEEYSSTDDVVMKSAYGIDVVRRPKWVSPAITKGTPPPELGTFTRSVHEIKVPTVVHKRVVKKIKRTRAKPEWKF